MIANPVDVGPHDRIAALGRRVLEGGAVARADVLWLLSLKPSAAILELLTWANRVREAVKGNTVHLCSIVNAKAGGCSEDCKFCAQSAFYQTDAPRYGFVDPQPVREAAEKPRATATGLGWWRRGRGSRKVPCSMKSARDSRN
jgi:biotin synthase